MLKKGFTFMLIMVTMLTMSLLAGCGGQKELIGEFTGDGGTMTFSQDGKVQMDLSEDLVWILNGKENNSIYTCTFMKDNKVVSYEEAEYLYLGNGTNTFAYINWKMENDKIILYPGKSHETEFAKAGN